MNNRNDFNNRKNLNNGIGPGNRNDLNNGNDFSSRDDVGNRSATSNGSANRDPISGEPGAHPIGTGLGAVAGGAVAGAAAGTVVGPVGTVVGAAAGAVVGGLAGKGIAEAIDPTREDAYWRENYSDRPYVQQGSSYEDYGPAYGIGVDTASRHPGRSFEDVEPEMSQQWSNDRRTSSLQWDAARPAARDGWDRVSDRA